MSLRSRHARESAELSRIDRLLQRWNFVASADGKLWVQPPGPELTAGDLDEFVAFLSERSLDHRLSELVLDLSRVQRFGRHWTLLLAKLLEFVGRIAARCRLVALNAQPASVLRLYRNTPQVAALLASAKLEVNAA